MLSQQISSAAAASIQPSETSCSISTLPYELKRALRVQFREFIHYLEDSEDGLGVSDKLIRVSRSAK